MVDALSVASDTAISVFSVVGAVSVVRILLFIGIIYVVVVILVAGVICFVSGDICCSIDISN